MEVNFDEMMKQNKEEILKSNEYLRIEILIGKGNDLPYAVCKSQASVKEIAIGIKTMEEMKQALIQNNPLVLEALKKTKIVETFVKDSEKEGLTKLKRKGNKC